MDYKERLDKLFKPEMTEGSKRGTNERCGNCKNWRDTNKMVRGRPVGKCKLSGEEVDSSEWCFDYDRK